MDSVYLAICKIDIAQYERRLQLVESTQPIAPGDFVQFRDPTGRTNFAPVSTVVLCSHGDANYLALTELASSVYPVVACYYKAWPVKKDGES